MSKRNQVLKKISFSFQILFAVLAVGIFGIYGIMYVHDTKVVAEFKKCIEHVNYADFVLPDAKEIEKYSYKGTARVAACGGTVKLEWVTVNSLSGSPSQSAWVVSEEGSYSEEVWESSNPDMRIPKAASIFFAVLGLLTFGLHRWIIWLAKD